MRANRFRPGFENLCPRIAPTNIATVLPPCTNDDFNNPGINDPIPVSYADCTANYNASLNNPSIQAH